MLPALDLEMYKCQVKTLLRAPAMTRARSRTPWRVAIAGVIGFGLVIVPWRRRRVR